MRPETTDIEAVIRQSIERYDIGRSEHGQLDLSTDTRDFAQEAEEELLDCLNYIVFLILKLRATRDKVVILRDSKGK